MNQSFLDFLKDNATVFYHTGLFLSGLVTFLIFIKKWLSHKEFFQDLKLLLQVPSILIEIKDDQKIIFSEFKLQGKIINSILDTLELAQFLCDYEGKCIKVNSKWVSLTGLTEEDAKGHHWLLSVHHEDRDRVSEKWHDMIENNTPFEEIFRYNNRITNVITKVRCTATDVVDEDDKRMFILGLSRVL